MARLFVNMAAWFVAALLLHTVNGATLVANERKSMKSMMRRDIPFANGMRADGSDGDESRVITGPSGELVALDGKDADKESTYVDSETDDVLSDPREGCNKVFLFGVENTDECLHHSEFLEDDGDCRSASESLGRYMPPRRANLKDGDPYQELKPVGCYMEACDEDPTGKGCFFYNSRSEPSNKTSLITGTPICVVKKYVNGKATPGGDVVCPENYEEIKDEMECREAGDCEGQCLSHDFRKNIHPNESIKYPYGCFKNIHWRCVQFNLHQDSPSPQADGVLGVPICRTLIDPASGRLPPGAKNTDKEITGHEPTVTVVESADEEDPSVAKPHAYCNDYESRFTCSNTTGYKARQRLHEIKCEDNPDERGHCTVGDLDTCCELEAAKVVTCEGYVCPSTMTLKTNPETVELPDITDATQISAHDCCNGVVPEATPEEREPTKAVNTCDNDYPKGKEMTNECDQPHGEPGHRSLILDEAVCRDAADKAGIQSHEKDWLVKLPDEIHHPRGCFADTCKHKEGKICYFFNGANDLPHEILSGTPICKRHRFAKGVAKPNDIQNGCPPGYQPVMDEEFCMDAGPCIGYMAAEDNARVGKRNASEHMDHPIGCFANTYDHRTYYNFVEKGFEVPSSPQGIPICNVSSTTKWD